MAAHSAPIDAAAPVSTSEASSPIRLRRRTGSKANQTTNPATAEPSSAASTFVAVRCMTHPARRGEPRSTGGSRARVQAVTDAPHGLDESGPARIVLDLHPQTPDVNGDSRLVAVAPAPDLTHQMFTAERLARI